ncbi:Uncharacterised protein [Vibrio cholerae]|nr:Uncharacterised protein [Vibrio cholerae]
MEYHTFIHSVQELRAEVFADYVHHLFFDTLIIQPCKIFLDTA